MFNTFRWVQIPLILILKTKHMQTIFQVNIKYLKKNAVKFTKLVIHFLNEITEKAFYLFILWCFYQIFPDILLKQELYILRFQLFMGAWLSMAGVLSDKRREDLELKKITQTESDADYKIVTFYDFIWFVLSLNLLFLFF